MQRILIANRGEIASRVLRTCREMGIATVAVFADGDADKPYVVEADEAARLPGTTAKETYLNVGAVLAVAERLGADAVHPGYGFLSEDASFASACAERGLVFIGPSPEAIASMGSKLEAKQLMLEAGVPVLPFVAVADGGVTEAVITAADALGWPLLVKASAGGGGRGMRLVHSAAGLLEAVGAAQREAAAAFGSDEVFLERYIDGARHIEVQVVGDQFGRVEHLFERECSIQRRHQKIIEEAPSPRLDPDLRHQLCEAGVAAAKAVDYSGVGTVEFVVDQGGDFAFLEMNTRLQVEHPVTEMIIGADLVRLQIDIAAGKPLPADLPSACTGHSIEARLYAEDPVAGFLPQTGMITRFEVPNGPGLRTDRGVAAGSRVRPQFDALLAKIVVHAPGRQEAVAKLASALTDLRVEGVRTNRELLIGILRSDEFASGAADTSFLERHDPAQLVATACDRRAPAVHAVAATLDEIERRRLRSPHLPEVPRAWRNNPSQPAMLDWGLGDRVIEVCYWHREGGLDFSVDGQPVAVGWVRVADGIVDVEVDGVLRRCDVSGDEDVRSVASVLGATTLRIVEPLPAPAPDRVSGALVAPTPGVILRVAAGEGSVVAEGDLIVVLESMKTEFHVRAAEAGTVTRVSVGVGDQVDAGTVLAVMST